MLPGGLEPHAFEAAKSGAAPAPTIIVVVSDAGPLIALGRLNLIGLLGALFAEVQVPAAVIRECLARPDNPDARRIGQALDQGRLVACPTPLQTLRGWAPASRLPSCTPKPSALRCCLTNGPGVSLRWTWA